MFLFSGAVFKNTAILRKLTALRYTFRGSPALVLWVGVLSSVIQNQIWNLIVSLCLYCPSGKSCALYLI